MQRQLPLNTVLSVGYVAHRGLHAWQVYDINQPTVGALQANPGVNVNYLRPYKGFAAIQEEESDGEFHLQLAPGLLERARSKADRASASPTRSPRAWTAAPTTATSSPTPTTPATFGDRRNTTRGTSSIVNYIYDLPFFKSSNNLAGKLLGGWEIAGTAQFQTGTPCGIGTNNDFAGVGEFGSFGCGSEGQFWVLNGSPQITTGSFRRTGHHRPLRPSTSPPTSPQPATGTFNLQSGVRDSVYQPGFQDWNLALLKIFPGQRAEPASSSAPRRTISSITPNLSGPNLNPTSSQFGMITSKTGLARNLQLSLRFSF